MYGLRNRPSLDPATAKELDAFLSVLRTVWSREHNDDGTHLDVERPIHWLTGPWILGGPEAVRDDAYVRIPTPLPTGTYDDFNPPGFDTAIVMNVNATGGDITITGLQAPGPATNLRRRLVLFRNEDENLNCVLAHQDTGSAAINRFRFPNNADITLMPNESVWLLYDIKWLRWSKVG
jgi:hypothetical protein